MRTWTRTVLFRDLDASKLEHFCPQGGEFEHLVVADLPDLSRRRAHVRIGRVDAIDIGVDFTDIGADGGSDGDGGGVRAASPKRRDVAVFVDPLEAGKDRNFPGREGLLDA